MNEEATSEAQAAPESSEPPATPPPAPAGGGLPAWLPYFLMAVVPAVIVGILVYVFAGGSSGGGGNSAGILEAFLVPAEDSNTRVESYKGVLPADFPEFPLYDGADPVVSFAVVTPEGTTYRAILTTSAAAGEVFTYYQDVLDKDPWQVEIGQTGALVTGIQFTRPDNPDISGVIIVNESELDEVTVVQLIYEDLSAALTPGTGPSIPLLGASRPLPPGFPEAVPIYGTDGETIVIDSGFQRGAGGQVFIVSFLTQDTADDVIEFYRGEFEAQEWNVIDSENTDTTSFAIGLEFDDGQNAMLSGFLVADTYQEDANYTRVDVQLQVSNAARP
jgi:hypothetical protein